MSLFDLLIGVSCGALLGGALGAARIAKAGFAGYAVAVILGLALALGNAWLVHTLSERVGKHLQGQAKVKDSQYFFALYLPLLIWIPIVLFLGAFIAGKAIAVVT